MTSVARGTGVLESLAADVPGSLGQPCFVRVELRTAGITAERGGARLADLLALTDRILGSTASAVRLLANGTNVVASVEYPAGSALFVLFSGGGASVDLIDEFLLVGTRGSIEGAGLPVDEIPSGYDREGLSRVVQTAIDDGWASWSIGGIR